MGPSFIATALLIASSCQTAPPCEYVVPGGIARANTEADARMVAITAELFARSTAQLLGVEPAPPFVIYYDDRTTQNGVRNARIELGVEGRGAMRFLVAHELVHWYADGVWDFLPITLEEGLADYIALILAPEFENERRLVLGRLYEDMRDEEIEPLLSVSAQEWQELPEQQQRLSYALGFHLVEQLGLDGLRALCVCAQSEGYAKIPSAWLLR